MYHIASLQNGGRPNLQPSYTFYFPADLNQAIPNCSFLLITTIFVGIFFAKSYRIPEKTEKVKENCEISWYLTNSVTFSLSIIWK